MASSIAGFQENEGHAFSAMAPPMRGGNVHASSRLFDVFINHRGPDVKQTLARNLYISLWSLEIKAFLDSEELEFGGFFPVDLENGIRSASVHIAIFSKGYAKSAWCLAELELMLKTRGKIIPVFYDVNPSELRCIEKGNYLAAFNYYKEKGRYLDKLEEWKKALHYASHITGVELSKHNNDDDMLCKSIISAVQEELRHEVKPLFVADNPVGLDQLVEDFEKHSSQEQQSEEKIKMVGIWGMEGCGKTTLAAELFNRKRKRYNGSCFLSDVAEHQLPSLQYKLLQDLVDHRDRQGFETVRDGTSKLKYYLRRATHLQFFIVLDDIDRKDQIDNILFTDILNPGGLVIVTTRDKGVLTSAGITVCYEMKEMDPNHSRELFCWHAFRQSNPIGQYADLVDKFVTVCRGLPLSLRVFGLDVCGRTDPNYWHSILNEAGKGLHEDIKRILKSSFDKLGIEQKRIFMDAACFFIDKPKTVATRIWEVSGWRTDRAFQTLKERCLVDVKEGYREEFDEEKLVLRMNNHHRELAREMAKDSIPPRRLWSPQDLEILESSNEFQNVIMEANAHNYRFFYTFNSRCRSRITCFVGTSDDSTGMTSLIWLKLDLNGEKQTSIPPQIPLQNVRCLRIVYGRLTWLWNQVAQAPLKLKELLLYEVELDKCTESLEKLKYLEKLVLRGRYSYERQKKISAFSLLNCLRQLRYLNTLYLRHLGVDGVVAFSNSTSESPMENLEKIQISEEKHVRKVSISGNRCPRIKSLHLDSMQNLDAINLSRVTTLNFLELRFCRKLREISGISHLPNLVTLNIFECPEVHDELSLAGLSCLEGITIDGCKKLQDITGIEQLQRLKHLHLSALGHGGIQKCIRRLQTLPSEFTTLIGRAAQGAASSLTETLFSNLIGTNASSGIYIEENGIPNVSLNTMPHSLSAIIVCAVVQCNREEIIQIPIPRADSINSCIAPGEWIVTLVVTANQTTKSDWISGVSFGGEIKKGCIAMLEYDEEGKTFRILQTIVGQLYEN